MRRFAPERLLPLAVLIGAILLVAGELSDTFRFEGAGSVTLQTSGGGDRHHYALLVLGLFAIGALVVALLSGSKPAAIAVAAVGVTALLIFLIVDLPDVDKVGTFDDPSQAFLQAKAQPESGFWVELIGALVLTVCGGAMATLTPEQLRALRPGASSKDRRRLPSNAPASGSKWSEDKAADAPGEKKPAGSRGKARTRPKRETKPAKAKAKSDGPAWGAERGKASSGKKADPKRTPKPKSKANENGKPKSSSDPEDGEDGSEKKRDAYQR